MEMEYMCWTSCLYWRQQDEELIFIEILKLSKYCRNSGAGVFMHVTDPERKKPDYKECWRSVF